MDCGKVVLENFHSTRNQIGCQDEIVPFRGIRRGNAYFVSASDATPMLPNSPWRRNKEFKVRPGATLKRNTANLRMCIYVYRDRTYV